MASSESGSFFFSFVFDFAVMERTAVATCKHVSTNNKREGGKGERGGWDAGKG